MSTDFDFPGFADDFEPTLVKTVPWWEGPNKDAVVASIKVHDPEPEKTLAKAVTKVGAVDAVELVA